MRLGPFGVLHILHDRGGGTDLHVRGLVAALPGWRHVVASVAGDRIDIRSFRSTRQPAAGDGGFVAPDAPDTASFERAAGEPWRELVRSIAETFRVSLIHVHHLAESPFSLVSALSTLGISYGVTIHDLWFACPTVTLTRSDGSYCGGVTDLDVCRSCLAAQPAFASIDIGDWRRRHAALFAAAAFVIAPSKWAAEVSLRYFPTLADRLRIVPHALPPVTLPGAGSTTLEDAHANTPVAANARRRDPPRLPDDDWPVVAFIGAIGPDKGARRIERLAALARERDMRVRFVVIGYLDTHHGPWQSGDARLTVHGRYARSKLPALIAHYRPQLACFPSDGPESFSYTLSEAWSAQLPALVPPIGALAERVGATGAGWIIDSETWRDDARLLERIVELASSTDDAAYGAARSAAHSAAQLTAPAAAQLSAHAATRVVALPSAASMADATAECYAAALRASSARSSASPVDTGDTGEHQ